MLLEVEIFKICVLFEDLFYPFSMTIFSSLPISCDSDWASCRFWKIYFFSSFYCFKGDFNILRQISFCFSYIFKCFNVCSSWLLWSESYSKRSRYYFCFILSKSWKWHCASQNNFLYIITIFIIYFFISIKWQSNWRRIELNISNWLL